MQEESVSQPAYLRHYYIKVLIWPKCGYYNIVCLIVSVHHRDMVGVLLFLLCGSVGQNSKQGGAKRRDAHSIICCRDAKNTGSCRDVVCCEEIFGFFCDNDKLMILIFYTKANHIKKVKYLICRINSTRKYCQQRRLQSSIFYVFLSVFFKSVL